MIYPEPNQPIGVMKMVFAGNVGAWFTIKFFNGLFEANHTHASLVSSQLSLKLPFSR
jgi:hypothetical protein